MAQGYELHCSCCKEMISVIILQGLHQKYKISWGLNLSLNLHQSDPIPWCVVVAGGSCLCVCLQPPPSLCTFTFIFVDVFVHYSLLTMVFPLARLMGGLDAQVIILPSHLQNAQHFCHESNSQPTKGLLLTGCGDPSQENVWFKRLARLAGLGIHCKWKLFDNSQSPRHESPQPGHNKASSLSAGRHMFSWHRAQHSCTAYVDFFNKTLSFPYKNISSIMGWIAMKSKMKTESDFDYHLCKAAVTLISISELIVMTIVCQNAKMFRKLPEGVSPFWVHLV